jgi:cytoskeletal protein CcmA (bactofilin family)
MWKRENEPTPTTTPSPAPPASPRYEPEPPPARNVETTPGRAVIGASIQLQGELTGGEDLLVEGRVDGKISLAQNALTVGAKGRVAATVQARAIHVEGEVEGNLVAEELIVLRKSSRVKGDLVAPRVVIEDGARFKGSIDMEAKRPVTASGPRAVSVAADEPKRPADELKRPDPVKVG